MNPTVLVADRSEEWRALIMQYAAIEWPHADVEECEGVHDAPARATSSASRSVVPTASRRAVGITRRSAGKPCSRSTS